MYFYSIYWIVFFCYNRLYRVRSVSNDRSFFSAVFCIFFFICIIYFTYSYQNQFMIPIIHSYTQNRAYRLLFYSIISTYRWYVHSNNSTVIGIFHSSFSIIISFFDSNFSPDYLDTISVQAAENQQLF